MNKLLHHRVTRGIARLLTVLCLLLWTTPPAPAFHKPTPPAKTQTPDEALRAKIARKEAAADKSRAQQDERELTPQEMRASVGRGSYRNRAFSGVLPWQRSLRDVNLSNGNLFKSFTDIQVPPARGAGLAFQRTYNSQDDRVGPFGIGWTHAYDIRIEEASGNKAERTDFFGGKHKYQRDADGLYSPPPYLYDELYSDYENILENGPPSVLEDTDIGKDGAVKHFFRNGVERACDYLEDRHGNRTVLEYGLDGGDRDLLTRVTDPSGRYLEISWNNFGTAEQPIWRITQVQGPFDPATLQPVYTVTYEYNGEYNLWKVRQDPAGLNRVTTFGYTSYAGAEGTETGLLASISDPVGNALARTIHERKRASVGFCC